VRTAVANETIVDQIFRNFRRHGERSYGERVSVIAHSLQAAKAAEQDNAWPTLVTAALLHDYGHLIHDLPEDYADQGIDSMHEEQAAAVLADFFVQAVIEPVRLHVAAKRYLCAVDSTYLEALSPASAQSLALQGGPFNAEEVNAFESLAYFTDAVRLRRYDDLAKDPDAQPPDLEHYRPYLEAALRS